MHKQVIHYRRLHRMEYCLRLVWDAHRPLWCLFTHPIDHMSLWHLCMFTLASVADPRLFDPRSVTSKHISLQWACNKHLSMVEPPNATVQTVKTAPGNILHLRQGLLLDHSGMEVSSRIIFESSGLRKQGLRPFFGFWYLHGGY